MSRPPSAGEGAAPARQEGPEGRGRGRPLRVYYAAGPGDVVATFRSWKQGRDDPGQISVTYSGQFFTVCKELGVKAAVVSWSPRPDEDGDEDFVVANRPRPGWMFRGGGLRFHLGAQWYLLSIVLSAIRYRADVLVLGGGGYLFLLPILRLFGIRLVVDSACVLWRTFRPRKRWEVFLRRLERGVYRDQAFALTSVSVDVTQQLTEVAGGRPRPILEYLPLYRRTTFLRRPPPTAARPFRVVFAGRVEENKGVLLLLELARRFRRDGREVVIEICGEGTALGALQGAVEREGLGAHLVLHGYCMSDRLAAVYDRSHAVIVPTTSDFIEGFNMVVAEGVLSGRPVITSAVCPAVHYLGDGALEVDVDDVDGYQQAIERLASEPELYQHLDGGVNPAAARLFDPAFSFGSAMRLVLEALRAGEDPGVRILPLAPAARLGTARGAGVVRNG